ncbi:hypothetical protein [Bosea sp. LjRoot237]|uniref:hypothetical protein n=1 Tax=Bosea sp. LjRoot237 TaxID=3342292 RepID=UPI003ED07BDB
MYHEKLKQFRKRSIEKALRAGLPAYFIDECLGDGVIRIKPDGAMELIVVQQGQAQIKPFECRTC